MDTTPQTQIRKGPRPSFTDTPMSNLIAATGLNDTDFASLSGAKIRTVRAWRRGEKATRLERYEELKQTVADRFGADIFSPK